MARIKIGPSRFVVCYKCGAQALLIPGRGLQEHKTGGMSSRKCSKKRRGMTWVHKLYSRTFEVLWNEYPGGASMAHPEYNSANYPYERY